MGNVISINRQKKDWIPIKEVMKLTGWTYASAYNTIVTQGNITHRTKGGVTVCSKSLDNFIKATTKVGKY